MELNRHSIVLFRGTLKDDFLGQRRFEWDRQAADVSLVIDVKV
jgi:hypothetical protein